MKRGKEGKARAFSEVLFRILSYSYIVVGLFLLLFPTAVNPELIVEVKHPLMKLMLQFLGSVYFLLGLVVFIIRKIDEIALLYLLLSFVFIGCINLYLTFKFTAILPISSVYFFFQIAQIFILLVALSKANKQIEKE